MEADVSVFNYSNIESSQLEELSAFFSTVYRQSLGYGSSPLFKWKIFNNINSAGLIRAAFVDGKIVSTTTITPKALCLHQSLITVAEIGDTYTSENFQRRGLFATLVNQSREYAEAHNLSFIYGTPNSNSLPGYLKKCQFEALDNLSVSSFSIPLSTSIILNRFAPKDFIRFVDYIFHKLVKLFFRLKSRGVQLEIINSFDSHHDVLWDRIKVNYEFSFLKSGAQLKWRFLDNPYEYTIYNIRARDQLLGLIVTRPSEDRKTLYIAEAFSDLGKLDLFSRAVARLVYLTLGKYERINLWSSLTDPLTDYYKKNFFFKRNSVPVIAFKNSAFKDVLTAKVCHFSLSDSDNV